MAGTERTKQKQLGQAADEEGMDKICLSAFCLRAKHLNFRLRTILHLVPAVRRARADLSGGAGA